MNSKNLKFLHNSGKSGSQYRHFHKGKTHKRIVLYWSNPSEGRKKSLSDKKLYLRFNQGFPDNFIILSHNFQTVFDTEIKIYNLNFERCTNLTRWLCILPLLKKGSAKSADPSLWHGSPDFSVPFSNKDSITVNIDMLLIYIGLN